MTLSSSTCMTSSTGSCKAVPYRVCDVGANAGWMSIGVDHDTAALAAAVKGTASTPVRAARRRTCARWRSRTQARPGRSPGGGAGGLRRWRGSVGLPAAVVLAAASAVRRVGIVFSCEPCAAQGCARVTGAASPGPPGECRGWGASRVRGGCAHWTRAGPLRRWRRRARMCRRGLPGPARPDAGRSQWRYR